MADTSRPGAESVAHGPDEPTTRVSGQQFLEMSKDPEFLALRKRLFGFLLPMTVAFLSWYLVYVLLGVFAHDFMSTPVIGNINLGLILGLLQFVTTFLITGIYVRFADRTIDPMAEKVRARLESEAK